MTRLVISPVAERDLEDIWLTIAVDNERAATRLVRKLDEKMKRLQRFPHLGPRRPDIRQSVRMLVEGPYLVLYETQPDADEGGVDVVDIIRVVHGRRDLTRLL